MANLDKVTDCVGYFLLLIALVLLAAVSCCMIKVLLYCMVNLLAL